MADSDRLVVAAIDFGTTYSGVAFSFKHEFDENPRKVNAIQWMGEHITLKAPTSVLITRDGKEVDSFGYDAETKYQELIDDETSAEWYFFRRFKMALNGEKTIQPALMLEDVTGKKMSALKVFSLSIKYLKDYPRKKADNQTLDTVSEDDIHWVLTVPAIWNDTAKQFMRKAAEMAGIDDKRLTIALEPEAASLYCRCIPFEQSKGEQTGSFSQFQSGTKYLVLDAGGGTVDITVREITFKCDINELHHATGGAWKGTKVDKAFEELFGGTVDITVHEITFTGDIKELHHATGGAWGGTKVDEACEELLKEIIGDEQVEDFKRDKIGEYFDMFMDFEMKKRKLHSTPSGFVTIKVPKASLDEHLKKTPHKNLETAIASSAYSDRMRLVSDKLRIDVALIKELFLPTVNNIVSHVKDLLDQPAVRDCSAIVMVGGFSECQFLQEKVREAFPTMKVIIPEEAGLAVLKGAVIFGHKPTAIAERVCKYTYGELISHVKDDEFCYHPPGETYIDENGDERCDNMFVIHVQKGQSIKLGEKQEEIMCYPIHDDDTYISIQIYASTEEYPYFVTDTGCQKIGRFDVSFEGGSNGEVGVTFVLGGTEIEVIAEDKLTGQVTKHRVEFLG